MRTILVFLSALLFAGVATGQVSQSLSPETVVVPSGDLHLKAFFWKPMGPGPFPAVLFNHGSGSDATHTAGMLITDAAATLAPLFLKHGYAFLYLFRRGQGLSASQAPFMRDLLQREEVTNGKEGRQHLQFILATTDQLDDVLAALSFLKTVPGIDAKRIAMAGHSFGGQLTLLAAGRDATLRAAVTFAAAADSWERSPELREALLASVPRTNAAIMLTQAENDYSTVPGRALADESARLHKPCMLKIYSAVGQTSEDGHNMLYEAMPYWEDDVFKFLDEHVRR